MVGLRDTSCGNSRGKIVAVVVGVELHVANLVEAVGLRRGRTYLLLALAVGMFGYGIYASLVKLRPLDEECVRLGAGSAVARRFEIAEWLASESRTNGLLMEVEATKGFEDSMRQVSEGKLDAALVSSGLQVLVARMCNCWRGSMWRRCIFWCDASWRSRGCRWSRRRRGGG